MDKDFSAWLDRFDMVVTDPRGYLVRCPAHDDQRPSLLLTLKDDGRLLIYCRAGCDRDQVLHALGLQPRDLFGWEPGDRAGITVHTGGGDAAGPPPGAVAALRMWLDHAAAVWEDPQHLELVDAGEQYVFSRFGLDVPAVERLGLGLSPRGTDHPFAHLSARFRAYPRLVVPLYDFAGIAKGAQGRDLSGGCSARWVSLSNPQDGEWSWAKYGVLRGGGSYDAWIITEGPSDGLTVAALGYDVVMVRGAGIAANPALARELAVNLRGREAVIAGDADAAGWKFTQRLAEALREHGHPAVSVLDIPLSGGDITDWRARDPDGFPVAFHRAVREARAYEGGDAEKKVLRGRVLERRTGMGELTKEESRAAVDAYRAAVERYGKTDAARAHALAAFLDGQVKYSPGLGFYVWNGRIWEPSESKVRAAVHRMGAALAMAQAGEEATGFLNTGKIDALLTELKAVPAVHVHASAFDAHPELLTFRNGVVDLRTGELRDHDPADLITQMVDVDYDPEATAPRWERFLGEIFPDNPEMVPYIRRLVGYGITGHTEEQCFAVLWGKGANGKSVFTDTLTHVFRGVTKTTPFDTFEAKPGGGGIPNDLAALRGARLVMASEGEAGKPMAEAVLKRATGTDLITARFLRREFFEFRPTFLLFLASNHKPRFESQDEGLWRRVKLIPFRRFFAPHERDHTLPATLRKEAAGIVAWAVRGAIEWYRNGLQDPPLVQEATEEYRATSDRLAGFYPGVLVPKEDGWIVGNLAYQEYRRWCELEGLSPREVLSRQKFYVAMEERGATRRRTRSGVTLYGVALNPDSHDNM